MNININDETRHKMEIFLRERKNGRPRELCSIEAKVSMWQVDRWCFSGEKGIGENQIYFYKTKKGIIVFLDNLMELDRNTLKN